MTYEEAKGIIQNMANVPHCYYCEHATDGECSDGCIRFQKIKKEACQLAIEALEKHTPQKPNWLYDDEPYCPTCQCALREYEEVCGECTQLIDWGE